MTSIGNIALIEFISGFRWIDPKGVGETVRRWVWPPSNSATELEGAGIRNCDALYGRGCVVVQAIYRCRTRVVFRRSAKF